MVAVKEDRQAFEIQVSAAEPVVRELLRRDEWLSDLEVTNAGLEEAFPVADAATKQLNH